jgi:hypothetical protein
MATIQDLGKVAYFNKGVYNSETNYEINDVVSYNGSSYVSLLNNNQGNLPTNTTYWSVVAQKGDKGDTGKPFVIEKTYESIEDMVADYDNMQVNDYVMIKGNIEEEENATLWTKTETEVSPYKWVYLADFSGASGITGATPNIQIGNVTEGNEPSVTRRAGSSNENPILDFVLKTGATGATGATGNGISSVSKTSTSGLTDTYTIAYTNGNNTTFDVNNGKGISNIAKTSTSGLVDTYTITYNDNSTSTFEITNGEDGEVTQEQLDETNSEIELVRKIYNAFPTTSSENESITLNGTAEVQFKNFELKGNTSQETTTGKNISNWIQGSINSSGAFVDSQLSICTDYISVNNGDSFTSQKNTAFSGTNDNMTCRMFDSNKTYLASVSALGYNNLTQTITLNNADVAYVRFTQFRQDGLLVNNDYEIMVERGSTASNYEPFTGNQPSPNPDYPQDIQVVTGDNSIKVEGKNLFNLKDTYYKRLDTGSVTTNNNNISVENTNTTTNQFVWWNIPVMIGEQITISYNSLTESTSDNNNGINYMFSDEPYTSFVSFDNFSKVNKTNKYVTTTATKEYLVIGLRNVPSCTNICSKLQVELGSAVSEYQEFQGRQIYSVNLPVKNLFDNSLMTEWSSTIRYISVNVDKNTDYTLSTSNPGQGATSANVFLSTSNSSVTSNENGAWNDKPRTINSGNNNIIYVAYRGTIEDKTQYWYQLEKGSKANRYTTFGTTPIELCKIGDYQDYFYKSNNKWYVEKQIGKVVLDGSEDWSIQSYQTQYYYRLNTNIPNQISGYCNYLNVIPNNETIINYTNSIRVNISYIDAILDKSNIPVADFQTWLSTHNTILYYALATPTTTEITDTTLIEQLNNLEKAYSYDTQTNISQINADKPFIINAEAIMSLKNILN